MIRIWPWTKFAQLEAAIAFYKGLDSDRLFRVELYKSLALKSRRELAAAHKGIRRLKERVKRLERAGHPQKERQS